MSPAVFSQRSGRSQRRSGRLAESISKEYNDVADTSRSDFLGSTVSGWRLDNHILYSMLHWSVRPSQNGQRHSPFRPLERVLPLWTRRRKAPHEPESYVHERRGIEGEGVDDIAPFGSDGRFDCATSTATWIKAYVGMHTVEYSGVFLSSGNLRGLVSQWRYRWPWIWPHSLASASADICRKIEQRFGVQTGLDRLRIGGDNAGSTFHIE